MVPASLYAQGTAFTYQGRLQSGANAANGSYDITFALYNASSGGSQVGSTITDTGIGVSNGLFTVIIDFGGVFNGSSYWLQIGVRSNGVGSYNPLSPRQELTPTPYAITAENLNGLVSASQVTGAPSARACSRFRWIYRVQPAGRSCRPIRPGPALQSSATALLRAARLRAFTGQQRPRITAPMPFTAS